MAKCDTLVKLPAIRFSYCHLKDRSLKTGLPAREIGRQAVEHFSRSIIGNLVGRRRVSCDIELIKRGTCEHTS